MCFAVPSKLRRAIEDTQMSWPPNPRQNRLRAQPFGAHSAQRHVAWLRRKRAEDRCAAYRIVVVGHFLHEILGRLTAQAEQSVSHQTAHERRTRTVHGKNAAAGRWGRAGEARQEGRGTMRSPFHLLRSSLSVVVPSGVSGVVNGSHFYSRWVGQHESNARKSCCLVGSFGNAGTSSWLRANVGRAAGDRRLCVLRCSSLICDP